jgi:hypothetical protein
MDQAKKPGIDVNRYKIPAARAVFFVEFTFAFGTAVLP